MIRTPPHSYEAESSILGGLLLNNAAYDRLSTLQLGVSDFYKQEHKIIYGAIVELIEHNQAADVITVHDYLIKKDPANHACLPYLNQLAQYVPSASNIHHYAEIVLDRAQRRRLIEHCDDVADSAYNPEGRTAEALVQEAEQSLFGVSEQGTKNTPGFHNNKKLLVQLLDQVDKMVESGGAITGTSTGFEELDRMTSGLQGGDLIILAARPAMGKTSLGINIAENIGMTKELPVAVFSMEMNAIQLTQRICSSISRVNQTHIKNGTLSADDLSRFLEASQSFSRSKIFIDDNPLQTVSSIRANARRLHRQHGKLGLIVVDYLQLMGGRENRSNRNENRATELGDISRGLKLLARELNCPIIALSQLSRGVEQRPDKRPMLSDLRDSGAIEQDADIVMFIYRDEYYTKEACKERGIAEIIFAKQRNNPVGTEKLKFLGHLTKFESLS